MGTIYRNGKPFIGSTSASNVSYDNSSSGLSAANVQAAMDEVNTKVNDNVVDIAELNNGLMNRFRVVTSGSLRNIKTAGIYYLTSGVTDKPTSNGGFYYCGFYGDEIYGGIFFPAYDGSATQAYLIFTSNGSTWETYPLSTKRFETTTLTATTTTSGAVGIPSADTSKTLVNAVLKSQAGFVFRRDNSYFTVADNDLNPLANTNVTIQATWMY